MVHRSPTSSPQGFGSPSDTSTGTDPLFDGAPDWALVLEFFDFSEFETAFQRVVYGVQMFACRRRRPLIVAAVAPCALDGSMTRCHC